MVELAGCEAPGPAGTKTLPGPALARIQRPRRRKNPPRLTVTLAFRTTSRECIDTTRAMNRKSRSHPKGESTPTPFLLRQRPNGSATDLSTG
jgi:hypothetical protein